MRLLGFYQSNTVDKILFDLWRMGFSIEELTVAYDDFTEAQIRERIARKIKEFALQEKQTKEQQGGFKNFIKENYQFEIDWDKFKRMYLNFNG